MNSFLFFAAVVHFVIYVPFSVGVCFQTQYQHSKTETGKQTFKLHDLTRQLKAMVFSTNLRNIFCI